MNFKKIGDTSFNGTLHFLCGDSSIRIVFGTMSNICGEAFFEINGSGLRFVLLVIIIVYL